MGSVWLQREGGREGKSGEEARRGEEREKKVELCMRSFVRLYPPSLSGHRTSKWRRGICILQITPCLSPSPRLTCCRSRTCSLTHAWSFDCTAQLIGREAETNRVTRKCEYINAARIDLQEELNEQLTDRQTLWQDCCTSQDMLCVFKR